MRVALSTISKFHSFDLARQLERLGVLERLFTGRPRWKMRGERLPKEKVSNFSVCQTVFEGTARLGLASYPLQDRLNHVCHRTLDLHVARHLPACDVFHALAYCGLESGARAQKQEARWICDSPTAHAAAHERLVREEHERVGVPYRPKAAELLDYEEASYQGCDRIVVASQFARQTFLAEGIGDEKVVVVPYGADLSLFRSVPVRRDSLFRVLFVGQLGVHKGIHDLARAARMAALPDLCLTLVGPIRPESRALLRDAHNVRLEIVGVRSKAELAAYYSQADVMVLPSISDGFGLVMGEAMACCCPVIASTNTGADHIVRPGVNGFVVPIRSPEAIADRLVWLHDHPEERRTMRQAAIEGVHALGGWDNYGDRMLTLYHTLLAA